MAALQFLAGEGFALNDLAGSGLGWYGSNYPDGIVVGQYNETTYITNAAGNALYPVKVDNVKYIHPSSGQLAGNDNRVLQAIPNYLSTLNVRFTNGTAVKVNNAQGRFFNRSDLNAPPSGIAIKIAPIIHPWTSASPLGSGATTWITGSTSGVIINMNDYPAATSPGMSGLSPNGSNTTDTQHDFYYAMSATPTQVGSALCALWISLEFS